MTGDEPGRVVAVNVGLPRDVDGPDGPVRTAIWKSPVRGRRHAGRLGLDGDGQADLVGHGGEHRALLVYQVDSYRHWERTLARELPGTGVFGENLTVTGLADDAVCIGDRYRVGGALVEVTQPRVTCFKVGVRLQEPRLPALLVSAGRPGFYLRVLEEGDVGAGDDVVRVGADPRRLTVAAVDALLYLPGRRRSDLERALSVPALPQGWRASFQDLLAQLDLAPPVPTRRGWRDFTVRSRSAESRDVTSFELVPDDGLDLPAHRPGQFVPVTLPADALETGHAADLVRSYSLSRAARPGSLRISVKREDRGTASRRLHDAVGVGDGLRVGSPRGSFVLDDAGSDPVVLLSAGVGATPVLAMLDALAAAGTDRPVWWVHVARDSTRHPFADETRTLLGALAHARSHIRYTRPLPTDRLGVDHDATGRLDEAALAALDLPVDADFYLCGPSGFMVDVPAALTALGADPQRVHTEAFGAAAPAGDRPAPHPPASGDGAGPAVTFSRSGLTVRWGGPAASLLELAEACDVPADWSCRTGVCQRCRTGLVDGDVSYDPAPLDPPGDGAVLLCCARPATDVVLDL